MYFYNYANKYINPFIPCLKSPVFSGFVCVGVARQEISQSSTLPFYFEQWFYRESPEFFVRERYIRSTIRRVVIFQLRSELN